MNEAVIHDGDIGSLSDLCGVSHDETIRFDIVDETAYTFLEGF